jgi:hypothetical protein
VAFDGRGWKETEPDDLLVLNDCLLWAPSLGSGCKGRMALGSWRKLSESPHPSPALCLEGLLVRKVERAGTAEWTAGIQDLDYSISFADNYVALVITFGSSLSLSFLITRNPCPGSSKYPELGSVCATDQ